jgi:hypothetical protein
MGPPQERTSSFKKKTFFTAEGAERVEKIERKDLSLCPVFPSASFASSAVKCSFAQDAKYTLAAAIRQGIRRCAHRHPMGRAGLVLMFSGMPR